jgi:hypothetical protein
VILLELYVVLQNADMGRSVPAAMRRTAGMHPGRALRRNLREAWTFPQITNKNEVEMPILLWLIGVPLSIVIVLMLFGVVGF